MNVLTDIFFLNTYSVFHPSHPHTDQPHHTPECLTNSVCWHTGNIQQGMCNQLQLRNTLLKGLSQDAH